MRTINLAFILVLVSLSFLTQACPIKVDKINRETLTCQNIVHNDLYCFVYRLEDNFGVKKIEDLLSIWQESKTIVSEFKTCRYKEELSLECYQLMDEFYLEKYKLYQQLTELKDCSLNDVFKNKLNDFNEKFKTYGTVSQQNEGAEE
jgi:hypothetical protein